MLKKSALFAFLAATAIMSGCATGTMKAMDGSMGKGMEKPMDSSMKGNMDKPMHGDMSTEHDKKTMKNDMNHGMHDSM